MKKYRLKSEATPFFKKGLATSIYDFDTWKSLQVDINALEEVEECHISYGQKREDGTGILGGWSKDDGTRFHFTLHFPSMKYREHSEFGNNRVIRELMDDIQRCANRFYEQFNNQHNCE